MISGSQFNIRSIDHAPDLYFLIPKICFLVRQNWVAGQEIRNGTGQNLSLLLQ